MKILLMANGPVGLAITEFLVSKGEALVGLGIHGEDKRVKGQEIIEASQLSEDKIFLGSELRKGETLDKIKSFEPDIAISAFWAYIFKPEFLKIPPKGTINFHPGYLPYSRGKNPNVWPIVEKTPGGVSLHYVDEGIDTGDIIARREIPIEPTDTGGSYYQKTLDEIVVLFKETWPKIKSGDFKAIRQSELDETPTFHLGKEVDELDRIDLDRNYTGREILDRLRARTYGERSFAYFEENGKKVYVGVKLKYG